MRYLPTCSDRRTEGTRTRECGEGAILEPNLKGLNELGMSRVRIEMNNTDIRSCTDTIRESM